MPSIVIYPQNITVETEVGSTVLSALLKAGIAQDAPCGGNGKCGKCKVLIGGQKKLACRETVEGNMTVTLIDRLRKAAILETGKVEHVIPDPVVPADYHCAIDIGTTTVVAYLLSGRNGEILRTTSMLNPQYPYGADVISRIQAALSGQLETLSELINEGVRTLLLQLCEAEKILTTQIGTICFVGNPAMQQLFLGISPENLAAPPFAPVLTRTEAIIPGAAFRDILSEESRFLIVPDIAGYVGADTLGCVLSSGMYREDAMTLMIDIGTNGEMVLGNQERMVACSTAAGPALEGGRISSGMRGSEGAIDHVWIESDQIRFSMIGSEKITDAIRKEQGETERTSGDTPAGICGSGLIDATAVMLEKGILNNRGRIQKDYIGEGKDREYLLTEGISLTQNDIREIQMAKGAIAAGIQIMAQYLSITIADIDRVILCGAFGTYMKPESACRIGLLPEELSDRILAGGNAAGMGSRLMALRSDLFGLAGELADKIEPLELASVPTFQRVFADKMRF